ncbi:cation:proton antiporter [Psychromarinibacter sp. C21-152]|uniref:Cation:proton antiporter n=1 Tax=Psychromarinibacter sediminicola TaxID=3033385 RepID=A0AAE3NN52_9RHOB|nr:cation:proton antiporter [Psychromarinibacter sediminicola]MDF0600388.1 cation:proton antiporter [Psychromarinibacter sediminicola]
MEGFLFQATIYLATTVIAVPIAARLGLGSVLGYLVAGLLIGPVFHLVGETGDLQHFAEFGVVMMLFLIGLEMDPRALWDMRDRLLGLGVMQILITVALIAAGAVALGQPLATGLAIGMIFALSSTAIVLQTLSEKGLIQTSGGRSAFSVLLTQDIAVIPMLILLPLLAAAPRPFFNPDGSMNRPASPAVPHGEGAGGDGHAAAMSLVEGLPGWGATLVTMAVVAAVILGGIYLIRPLFHFIHTARLRELYTAFALLIVIGVAFVMTLVGLSPALGTFLAGVVLANSELRHELESNIEPFKGLLLGLFFITVGAGINVQIFFAQPFLLIGLTLAIMVIKGVVLFGLGRMFKLRRRDQWLFTLGLAQAGEFGFVLLSFSQQQGVLSATMSQNLLLIVALSMLLTPLMFLAQEFLSRWGAEPEDGPREDDIGAEGPIIIAGMGRFGQAVNRMVQMSGFRTTVLDNNLQTIQLMRKFGFKGYFGDPTRPDVLRAAGLMEAKVLVVALDGREAVTRLVAYARRERPDLHIVARARDRVHVYQLYRAGANDIVRELFDSSLRAGRYVLENMGLTDYEAAELERTYFKYDRQAVRSLAEVWKPGVPIDQNPEYIERTRELNAELEAALLRQSAEDSKEAS